MTVRAYSEVCEHKGLQLLIRVCFLEPWAGEWQRQSSRGVLKKSCHPWTLAVSWGGGLPGSQEPRSEQQLGQCIGNDFP